VRPGPVAVFKGFTSKGKGARGIEGKRKRIDGKLGKGRWGKKSKEKERVDGIEGVHLGCILLFEPW